MYMDIANVLKSMRIESGLTQQELSARLNIAQATIACYENGQRVPYISSLVAYADFFDCTLDYIVGRADEFGNRTKNADARASDHLSDGELELIRKYRKLTKEQRAALLGYMDGIGDRF